MGKVDDVAGTGLKANTAVDAAEGLVKQEADTGGKAVGLDTNAIIARLEGTPENAQAVVDAMAGRAPRVSITAVKESFAGGGSKEDLRKFLIETGGGVVKAAREAVVEALRQKGLKTGDANVVGSALEEGTSVLTRDKGILKKVPETAESY